MQARFRGPNNLLILHQIIPDKKRNTPLRTVLLSGRSQVMGPFSLNQCKGMLGTAALHIFCNQTSTIC